MKCPKCNGDMEKGISVDRGHYWNPGKQIWVKRIGFLKNEGKREIISYRCKKCGYLENYAK